MNKLIQIIGNASLVLALALVLAVPVVNADDDDDVKEVKINICHATSSESNPYEAINTSSDHSGHENDFAYAGPLDDKDKPAKDTGDQWCEDNVPSDEPEVPVVPPATPVSGQVLSTNTQVVATPKGGVNAGAGSAVGSLLGLGGSLAVAGVGASRILRRS